MQGVQELQWLAENGRPWAAQRAQMALQMAEAFHNGGLDQDEYRELMLDLVRMDRLDSEADDIETKTMLVTAVYAVAQIV
jgi:hypothetical protein